MVEIICSVVKLIIVKHKITLQIVIALSLLASVLLPKVGVCYSAGVSFPPGPEVDTAQLYKDAMSPSAGLNMWKWANEVPYAVENAFLAAFSPNGLPPNFGNKTSGATSLEWLNPGTPISGVFGYLGRGMAYMYETPATGGFNHYMASIGVTKPAYAAGYEVLSITLSFWKMLRNVAYIAMIVVFVVFGLMIMFRSKIDPRTTITISNSIPGAVVSLVLITFSYAIGGLMYDVFKVSNQIAYNVVASNIFNSDIAGLTGKQADGSDLFRCPNFGTDSSGKYYPCRFSALDTISVFGSWFGLAQLLGTAGITVEISSPFPGVPLLGSPFQAGPIIAFGLAMAVLSAAIKLFFALVTAYARFFINTVTAPLVLLMAAIPGGRESGVAKWLKGYLSATLSFVAVFFLMNFIYYIMLMAKDVSKPAIVSSLEGVPLLSLVDPSSIAIIIAFGLVLMLPAVPPAIDEMLETSPGRAVSGATSDMSQIAKKIPIIGGFLS